MVCTSLPSSPICEKDSLYKEGKYTFGCSIGKVFYIDAQVNVAPVVEIISPCLLGGPGGCFGDGYVVVDTVHVKAGHCLGLC